MADTQNVVEGLVAWSREVLPELQNGYSYLPSGKGPLPDVVVEVMVAEVAEGDPRFPYSDIQQSWLRTWDCELSFMVENDDTQAAAEMLEDFSDRLLAAALQDVTLGGRVPFISPIISFDFTPPFIEYPDGTRGREMAMSLAVGQPMRGDS